MALALIMYCGDNQDRFPPNHDGGQAGKSLNNEAWVAGWLDANAATDDNTNILMLVNPKVYQFGAYLGPYIKNPAAFKCPADKSLNPSVARDPRVRSISMNSYIGDRGTTRTWVGGTNPRYKLYHTLSAVKTPTMCFCFLDERQDSINDGWFATDADTTFQIIDYPASYHGNAGGFSFLDGHSEIHRWRDPRTMPPVTQGNMQLNVASPGNQDVLWWAQRAAGVNAYP
jgi:prepilin-type processing-associated H-X9-DG protein